jgi:hypothetical protein
VFPYVSWGERRQADLFFADLVGRPLSTPLWRFPAASEAEEAMWSEAVATLPSRYRVAYYHAQQAEEDLDAETVDALTVDLLSVNDQAGLDEFVNKLGRTVSRAAKKTARDIGRTKLARTVSKAATDVSRTKLVRTAARAATDVSKGVAKVGAAVPMLGTAVKLASRGTPLGAFARAAYGAMSAALRGQNILMGAVDGLAGTPLFGAAVKLAQGVLRGDNLLAAVKVAAKAGIADAREALRFAAMVAPFVPGIGTGVGAALGAADALANGQPITQALIAGVRGAIPGGVIAQAAFDTAAQLAQGKRLDQALLTAARNRLPPGPAQAAFDTGLAIAQGKKLQDAMVQGAGRLLPASPYSADALSFARRALAGDNLGQAALSAAGNAVLRRAQQQGADLVATVQGRVAGVVPVTPVAPSAPRPIASLDQAIGAADVAARRQADLFAKDFARARVVGRVGTAGTQAVPIVTGVAGNAVRAAVPGVGIQGLQMSATLAHPPAAQR